MSTRPRHEAGTTPTTTPTIPPGGSCWLVVDGEWVLRSRMRVQVDPEYAAWLRMHQRRGRLDRHLERFGERVAA